MADVADWPLAKGRRLLTIDKFDCEADAARLARILNNVASAVAHATGEPRKLTYAVELSDAGDVTYAVRAWTVAEERDG